MRLDVGLRCHVGRREDESRWMVAASDAGSVRIVRRAAASAKRWEKSKRVWVVVVVVAVVACSLYEVVVKPPLTSRGEGRRGNGGWYR